MMAPLAQSPAQLFRRQLKPVRGVELILSKYRLRLVPAQETADQAEEEQRLYKFRLIRLSTPSIRVAGLEPIGTIDNVPVRDGEMAKSAHSRP